MKNTLYKQCRLERVEENSTISQVAWIPSKYAKIGGIVTIRNESDEWVDGWVVKSASDEELAEKDLPDSHQGIKGHRKSTGDAMAR